MEDYYRKSIEELIDKHPAVDKSQLDDLFELGIELERNYDHYGCVDIVEMFIKHMQKHYLSREYYD